MNETTNDIKKEKSEIEILNEDLMMERGKFTANGHTFTVHPIYLGEEDEYLSEMNISPVPSQLTNSNDNGDTPTDKELGRWAIALFSSKINGERKKKKKGFLKRIFSFLFHRNDHHYYKEYEAVYPLVKWIEKKVTYKGHKIKFYDLERKYGLNKAEIEKLFMYFHELSGF